MPDKILSLLSLSRRANRISIGFAESKEAVLKGKSRLVIVGSDISAKTEKEIRFFCKDKIIVERISQTREQISNAIGKSGGVISVNDEGFAKSLLKLIKEEPKYVG